ncbi:MAG: hypothetical protein KDB07_08420 [Planctomycetes bacterium]|nr:hypothetical protein [Planctomycetota bacterium]
MSDYMNPEELKAWKEFGASDEPFTFVAYSEDGTRFTEEEVIARVQRLWRVIWYWNPTLAVHKPSCAPLIQTGLRAGSFSLTTINLISKR